tara:strand:- start:626 stop:1627 length:1002 start_codon:yes stop_codon:yes gene_type:complete
LKSTLQTVPVDLLRLDLENPRLYSRKLAGDELVTDSQLEQTIADEGESFMALYKAILKVGVRDPIWVKMNSDGTYTVIEGNRRTTVLRRLIENEAQAPDGVSFDNVQAHVVDDSVSDLEIKLQKVRLQSGKKAWGVVNDAAVVHEFHHELHMALEDIATEMQVSVTKVKKLLKSFRMYLDYVRTTGDSNEKRFAFFNEAPAKVIEWVETSPRNKSDYYEWMTPVNGKAKIRSASTGRGSLRDFSKCLDEPEAIELLREDPDSTVEDAFEIVKENDVLKDMTFLKRVLPMAKNLNDLDDSQISRLSNERRIVVHIRSLMSACERALGQIEEMQD